MYSNLTLQVSLLKNSVNSQRLIEDVKIKYGRMAEWSKAPDLSSGSPERESVGSNPTSATFLIFYLIQQFFVNF